jgi:ankyrin repeat protein
LHTESDVPLVLLAAQLGNCEIVRLFLNRGADPNTMMPTADEIRMTFHQLPPLIIDTLEFPEPGQTTNEPIEDGETLLHIAAASGQPDLVNLLLETNAIVNSRTTGGMTPLYCAASTGDEDSVSNLLHYQADVLAMTSQGWTMLHAAADGGLNVSLVQQLHEWGIDMMARNVRGETALHYAASRDDLDVIQYLLDNGADANTVSYEDRTPLHQALQAHLGNDPDIIRALLEKGADSNARYRGGLPPLHMALLSDWGCDTEIIRVLLEHNADGNATDDQQRTALHVSVDYNTDCEVEVIQLLIDHGADLYYPDAAGLTSYEMIRNHSNPECKELFKSLASPSAASRIFLPETQQQHVVPFQVASAFPLHQQIASYYPQPSIYPSEATYPPQQPGNEPQPRAETSLSFHHEPLANSASTPLQMASQSQGIPTTITDSASILTSLEDLRIASSASAPNFQSLYGQSELARTWPQPGFNQPEPYQNNILGGIVHQHPHTYPLSPGSITSTSNHMLQSPHLYCYSPAGQEQWAAPQTSQGQQYGYSTSITDPDAQNNLQSDTQYDGSQTAYSAVQQAANNHPLSYVGRTMGQASEPWPNDQTRNDQTPLPTPQQDHSYSYDDSTSLNHCQQPYRTFNPEIIPPDRSFSAPPASHPTGQDQWQPVQVAFQNQYAQA